MDESLPEEIRKIYNLCISIKIKLDEKTKAKIKLKVTNSQCLIHAGTCAIWKLLFCKCQLTLSKCQHNLNKVQYL